MGKRKVGDFEKSPTELLRRLDSNERPPGYEPGELPTAPLRVHGLARLLIPCLRVQRYGFGRI